MKDKYPDDSSSRGSNDRPKSSRASTVKRFDIIMRGIACSKKIWKFIMESLFSPKLESRNDRILDTALFFSSRSLFFNVLAWSVTRPFLQARRDELNCDASCYANIISFRSLLEIFSGFLIGKLSDSRKVGRRPCLFLSCAANIVGLGIGGSTFSIRGMYYCIVPVALFSRSFTVSKALLSDFHELVENTEDETIMSVLEHDDYIEDDDATVVSYVSKATTRARKPTVPKEKENIHPSVKLKPSSNEIAIARANSMGKLGLAVGLAVMIGPTLGATIARNYNQSALLGSILNGISLLIVLKIPIKIIEDNDRSNRIATINESKTQSRRFFPEFLLEAGPLLLMIVRFFTVLSFHVFQTIWAQLLEDRFDFGPVEHGYFMTFVGLTYAYSLGYIAKYVVAMLSEQRQRTVLLLIGCVILCLSRCLVFCTHNLIALYAIFFVLIVALGVVNTIMNLDASDLVPSAQVGALFGALESVESGAGAVGPFLAEILSIQKPLVAPLILVIICHSIVFGLVYWGYQRYVLIAAIERKKCFHKATEKRDSANKI